MKPSFSPSASACQFGLPRRHSVPIWLTSFLSLQGTGTGISDSFNNCFLHTYTLHLQFASPFILQKKKSIAICQRTHKSINSIQGCVFDVYMCLLNHGKSINQDNMLLRFSLNEACMCYYVLLLYYGVQSKAKQSNGMPPANR